MAAVSPNCSFVTAQRMSTIAPAWQWLGYSLSLVDNIQPAVLLRYMSKYDPNLDQCFSALGDPTRRMILQRLARGEASVSELAEPHDMALPSFMEHLKKLEVAGLVTSKKQGRTRTCELAPDAFAPAKKWLSEQSEIWEGRLDRFDDYVKNLMQERQK